MNPVLRVSGMSKRFGGIVAADNVTLDVAGGELVGLIGPNGAGKTTLFNLITGVLRADAGTVAVNGQRAEHLPVHDRAALGIARTWQHTRLFASLSILDNLIIGARDYPGEHLTNIAFKPGRVQRAESRSRDTAIRALELVGLDHRADAIPGELSYGQQKLVGIARAIMNEGHVLLLDEPLAGVSGHLFDKIKAVIAAQAATGKAIVIVEHNVSFVRELCSRAVFMFNGAVIAEGAVEKLMADPRLTELYFGAPV